MPDGPGCNLAASQPARPTQTLVRLFDQIATGTGMQLPGWRFLLLHYFLWFRPPLSLKGLWGKTKELSRFKEAYTAEAAKLQACRQGSSVTATQLDDGTIQLTVGLGA